MVHVTRFGFDDDLNFNGGFDERYQEDGDADDSYPSMERDEAGSSEREDVYGIDDSWMD
jgi:hypothetical protein